MPTPTVDPTRFAQLQALGTRSPQNLKEPHLALVDPDHRFHKNDDALIAQVPDPTEGDNDLDCPHHASTANLSNLANRTVGRLSLIHI